MAYKFAECCGKRSYVKTERSAENGSTLVYTCNACGVVLKQAPLSLARDTRRNTFEAFKSPVDGSIITTRRELAEHNRRNNVMNIHDGYDEEAYQNMIKKDFQKELDDERRKDLQKDISQGLEMLHNGYAPATATEDEIIPE